MLTPSCKALGWFQLLAHTGFQLTSHFPHRNGRDTIASPSFQGWAPEAEASLALANRGFGRQAYGPHEKRRRRSTSVLILPERASATAACPSSSLSHKTRADRGGTRGMGACCVVIALVSCYSDSEVLHLCSVFPPSTSYASPST
jgi:hypothetical protein